MTQEFKYSVNLISPNGEKNLGKSNIHTHI